ncbi:hypothetical protein FRC04_012020 [Tulasnella sp. 424]|nr:hypothetical protein FRC04_012020 [Tulasnella sp. 424]
MQKEALLRTKGHRQENVLIDDYATAMLCDLGLASIVDETQAPSGLTTSQSLKGSTRYMCPELLMELETKHTLAGDVWAWACTVFQILTNVEPYANAKAEFGVIAAILQHESPGDLLMLSTGNSGEHTMNELRTILEAVGLPSLQNVLQWPIPFASLDCDVEKNRQV